jgi:hypothetical protein
VELHKSQTPSQVDGVYLNDLSEGQELAIRTDNRCYRVVNRGMGKALISGHPRYCGKPVLVKIEGSTWGGSALKTDFIGIGMHLQFRLPEDGRVTTSRIVEIRSASPE